LVADIDITVPCRLVELRAAQRTFEGAYLRTALSQFSFALIILKIFTSEFYAIGALFAVYGAAVMVVAIYRRYEGNRQFFEREESEFGNNTVTTADQDAGHRNDPDSSRPEASRSKVLRNKFRTSGNSVALLTTLSVSAYVALMVLIWTLAA
jgi:hypothetical protein